MLPWEAFRGSIWSCQVTTSQGEVAYRGVQDLFGKDSETDTFFSRMEAELQAEVTRLQEEYQSQMVALEAEVCTPPLFFFGAEMVPLVFPFVAFRVFYVVLVYLASDTVTIPTMIVTHLHRFVRTSAFVSSQDSQYLLVVVMFASIT